MYCADQKEVSPTEKRMWSFGCYYSISFLSCKCLRTMSDRMSEHFTGHVSCKPNKELSLEDVNHVTLTQLYSTLLVQFMGELVQKH